MKRSIITKLQNASRSDTLSVPIGLRPPKSSPVINSASRALSEFAADTPILLDPQKLHPSPYRDRLSNDDEAIDTLGQLRTSIEQEGQKIPILVRPHPDKSGEFQIAYGHRRWHAIKDLLNSSQSPQSIYIRANVRDLSDADLIREQSLENGVRENLSWIEKALWAVQLKQASIKQKDMAPILGSSEADVSRYFKVTSTIPERILFSIGRAKGAGRPKWMKLLEQFEKSAAAKHRLENFIASDEFRELASSERLDAAIKIASESRARKSDKSISQPANISIDGVKICTAQTIRTGMVFKIPSKEIEFASWLENNMECLYRQFKKDKEER